MAENLLGTISYINGKSQDLASGVKKSYADYSGNFSNVLDNVNKHYSHIQDKNVYQRNNAKNPNDDYYKVDNSKNRNDDRNPNVRKNKNDTSSVDVNNSDKNLKTDENKPDVKGDLKTDSKITDTSSQVSIKDAKAVDTKPEAPIKADNSEKVDAQCTTDTKATVDSTDAKTATETQPTVIKDTNAEAETILQTDATVEELPLSVENETLTEPVAQIPTEDVSTQPKDKPVVVVDNVSDALAVAYQNSTEDLAISYLASSNDSQAALKVGEDASKSQQVVSEVDVNQNIAYNTNQNLNVGLNNFSNELLTGQLNQDTAKPKVQPQTQQVLLNLDVKEESLPAQASGIASKDQVQAQPVDLKSQAPQIQASAEAIANANVNQSDSKTVIQDALDKSILTQDLLDKTNAKVVSVETSSNSNLAGQQNAQEQSVRIAIENNSNLAAGTDSVQGTNTFSKTMESVQQPKELNKADILAQIHTKMDQVKEDGTTKITIVLKPENLGKVNLELINGKDGLTARMTAENAQVKELLDKSLEGLKNSLSSQGVNVNSVTVKVAEVQKSSEEMFAFNQQTQSGEQQFSEGFSGSHNSENSGREAQSGLDYSKEFTNLASQPQQEEETTQRVHVGQVDYKI